MATESGRPEAESHARALAPYAPGLSIAEIREKYGHEEVIKLASNENPLGASPLAQEAIKRHAAEAFRYPQGGNPALAAAIAVMHGVVPERVVLGNGSDELIDLIIRIMTVPGRHNMLCFRPCFGIYPVQAALNHVEIRRQPLGENFAHDFTGLLALANADTRLVFITAPDNPSGYCPALPELQAFAEKISQIAPKALLVIDEAYMDFTDDEAAHSLLANGILPENTAFLRTFSKSWGLAGLRVGYAVLPERLAAALWKSRLPFSVNILAEAGALAAMQDDFFRQKCLATVREGRQWLTEELRKLGCRVWPSQANFIMFRLPEDSLPADEFFERLLAAGIIIRQLKSYDLPDNLRVSVGNPAENRKFIAAMKKILQGAKA